ncbi:spinster family MFS transporter [Cohaesibacter gelatinilyticus]|uniref:Predicted arabinose efflux permease, MFS family n=1 Tax=Cohaesibacter gelatinilyticus TaxID=372072 RepID=A0A285PI97_9HYPH|nr:MFS transporter [Cohaesibacter gelatinilyticus]SNZ21148.1 Predicted arabinose efflux permease, MFS family [Cohaesibacter gelatinilyticus]
MAQKGNPANRKLLYLLTAMFSLSYLDRQILNITLNDIGAEFSLTDLQLGSLSGIAFAIVYVVFGFPVARLVRPGNRKVIAVAALSFWSTMTALMGIAGSFVTLLLARIGVGVGEAGCVPPSHSMIIDAFPPEKRASALSFYSAGTNIGIFLAFLVGGILTAKFGWRIAFLAAGLPGIALAIWIYFKLDEPASPVASTDRQSEKKSYASLARALLADKSTRHTLIGVALTAMVGLGASAWIATFLIRVHALEIAQVGVYLAVTIGIIGAVGTWLGGVLSDRLGRKNPTWRLKFVAVTIVIAKPFSILFYLQDQTMVALVIFVIPAMVGAMFVGPSFSHLYSRFEASSRPMITAILMFVINLVGLGLGPTLVGLISDMLAPTEGEGSLRYALVLLQIAGLWAAVHFWIAGRAMSDVSARSRKVEALFG